jgi:hypothetical protein
MLAKELSGAAFNKAEHNRNLQQLLRQRPRGSIERKHQNISAVLIELGFPYIDGYKPLSNYQDLLRVVVTERLSAANELDRLVAAVVDGEVDEAPSILDILGIAVPAPVVPDTGISFHERSSKPARITRRNYLELEAQNRSLGLAGEELALRYEHDRLWRAGRHTLADRIEHVSKTKGDGLGSTLTPHQMWEASAAGGAGRFRLDSVCLRSKAPEGWAQSMTLREVRGASAGVAWCAASVSHLAFLIDQ